MNDATGADGANEGSVAEKTQETAKVGQLQVQLRTLRNEEREALADFGRAAYALHEEGALAERSGELAGAGAKIADVRRQLADKEAEVAEVRGSSSEAGDSGTVESSAGLKKKGIDRRVSPRGGDTTRCGVARR